MRKNIFKIFLSSIVLVLTLVTLVGCGGSKNKPTTTKEPDNSNTNNNGNNNNNNNNQYLSTARTIKVVQIEGNATVTDTEETTKCFPGMNLYDGDTLTVSKDSTLVVKFDDDKYVYLGENTVISIKSEGKDKHKTNIFVNSGTVLAEVQKKLDEDEEFFLSSNNSVMAVRGTIFGVNVKTVGEEIVEAYSVYKGVTELYVFDKVDGNIISGKISDISNAKYEIKIPKSHVLTDEEINNEVGEWLDKGAEKFDDATDANENLDEVQITVNKPTKGDYEKVINVVESDVDYSDIEYTSTGFFGEYDGQPHKAVITPITEGATVKYSADGVTYQDTNDFEFYSPGTYRVYYKIECAGHEPKTDFEVIYITRPNINLITDCISYDSNSKMSVINLSTLDPEDFNRYNGVSIAKVFNNQEFYINNNLVTANNITIDYNKIIDGYIELIDGKNTINVSFEFDGYTLNTEVYFLFSDTREDTGYQVGIIDTDKITQLSTNVYYINMDATYLTELGIGSMNADANGLLQAFGLDVLDLTTMLINYPNDVKGSDTATYDGTNVIYLEEVMYHYVEINFLVFPNATTKGFNESIFVIISNMAPDVIASPSYSINKTNYSYNPAKNADGVKMDFITVAERVGYPDYPQAVKYSLDGTNFQEELYITEAGTHKVYYEIVTNPNTDDYNIIDYEFINVKVGQGEISFDNKMFITSPVHIFSNDGNVISWTYTGTESFSSSGVVESTDGETITSLADAYTVYSNMIKNAVFYDSISGDAISATVTISEKKANSANFNYTIEAEGYETLSGTVRFDYSKLNDLYNLNNSNSSAYDSDSFTVTLPSDYSVSLSEVPQAIPSRISTTLESEFINYQVYYSIDNGKTWTTSTPKISEAGEYAVYVMYCFVDSGNDATTLVDGEITGINHSSLASNGNFIIAIQNITITD